MLCLFNGSINMFELNPYDALKIRKVDHLPVHFKKYSFINEFVDIAEIEHWILNKLSGRFYEGTVGVISKEERLQTEQIFAFEDEKELTFFILACPHLRRYT